MTSNEFTRKGTLVNKDQLKESKNGVKFLSFIISVPKKTSYESDGERKPKWESVYHKFVAFREKAELIAQIPKGTEIIVKGDQQPIRTYDLIPGKDNEKKKEIVRKLNAKGINLWSIDGCCSSNVREIIPLMNLSKANEPENEKDEGESPEELLENVDDDLPF